MYKSKDWDTVYIYTAKFAQVAAGLLSACCGIRRHAGRMSDVFICATCCGLS